MSNSQCVVIGAGLIGLSAACILAKSGLSVVVLEKDLASLSALDERAEPRPLSLNHASFTVLKSLGLEHFLADFFTPIKHVHVSMQANFGAITFSNKQLLVPSLGYVVSYSHLAHALYKVALDAGVKFVNIQQIDSIKSESQQVEVSAKTTTGIGNWTASVCIAADGQNSFCRQHLGLQARETTAQYTSEVFRLQLETEHLNRALQRFTKQGTLAVVPLFKPQQSRLIWTHRDSVSIPETLPAIADHFNSVYAGYVPRITEIERLGGYSLRHLYVDDPVQGRCVLMGNAAYSFYPITAQGFNTGLLDAAALAQLIVQAAMHGKDIGSAQLLRVYTQWRLPVQKSVMRLTQKTASIFDGSFSAFNGLRGLGLAAVEILPGIKRRLGTRLLGLAGRVPDLALGVSLGEKAKV